MCQVLCKISCWRFRTQTRTHAWTNRTKTVCLQPHYFRRRHKNSDWWPHTRLLLLLVFLFKILIFLSYCSRLRCEKWSSTLHEQRAQTPVSERQDNKFPDKPQNPNQLLPTWDICLWATATRFHQTTCNTGRHRGRWLRNHRRSCQSLRRRSSDSQWTPTDRQHAYTHRQSVTSKIHPQRSSPATADNSFHNVLPKLYCVIIVDIFEMITLTSIHC